MADKKMVRQGLFKVKAQTELLLIVNGETRTVQS